MISKALLIVTSLLALTCAHVSANSQKPAVALHEHTIDGAFLMNTNDMKNLHNDHHMNSIKLSSISSTNIRLHNYFGDNMVLNWEGDRIYGFSTLTTKDKITVSYSNKQKHTKPRSDGTWTIDLPKHNTTLSYNYTITSNKGDSLQLTNVWRGPTFRCSGQSNNVVTLTDMKTKVADFAYATATNYHKLHFYIQTLLSANATANNLANCQLNPADDIYFAQYTWTDATHPAIATRYQLIGATCVYQARALYEQFSGNYHVGMLENAVSSTIIEAHARPEVTTLCNAYSSYRLPVSYFNQIGCIGNAMYEPTKQTIFSLELWYQGESNRNGTEYQCLLPAYLDSKENDVYEQDTIFNVVQLHPFVGNSLLPRYPLTRIAQRVVKGRANVCYVRTGHIGDPIGRTPTDFGLHTGWKFFLLNQLRSCYIHYNEEETSVDVLGPQFKKATVFSTVDGQSIKLKMNNTDLVNLTSTVGYPNGCQTRNPFQILLSNGSWISTGLPTSSIEVNGLDVTIPFLLGDNTTYPVILKFPIYEDAGCVILNGAGDPTDELEIALSSGAFSMFSKGTAIYPMAVVFIATIFSVALALF